jgi:hypothetical protein
MRSHDSEKLQQSSSFTLSNYYNLMYTGPVLLGTPQQGSTSSAFIYDSGSGWLTVNTYPCPNCSSWYYNPAVSSTVTNSTYVQTELAYGSAQLNGTTAADTVCLWTSPSSTCVTGFSFFEILSQEGLDGLDGILGLSPAASQNGPSYLMNLYL